MEWYERLSWESVSFGDETKIEGKKNKSRHFKNSKWVESAQSQPQLWCKGLGKKAWLRLLQVWAKANCRPSLHFLPHYHWQHIRRALLWKKNKKKMRHPSTVEIKEKYQQHLQPPITPPNIARCSFLLLWIGGSKLNWRSVEKVVSTGGSCSELKCGVVQPVIVL